MISSRLSKSERFSNSLTEKEEEQEDSDICGSSSDADNCDVMSNQEMSESNRSRV